MPRFNVQVEFLANFVVDADNEDEAFTGLNSLLDSGKVDITEYIYEQYISAIDAEIPEEVE